MTPAGLKRIRLQLGLTQAQLAKQLGVGQNAVARWETGTRGISEPIARLVQRIAAEARGKRPTGGGKRARNRKRRG